MYTNLICSQNGNLLKNCDKVFPINEFPMKLIGRNHLQLISGIDPEIDRWLCAWVSEILNARWKTHHDVVGQYPSVTYRDDGVFWFPVASKRGRVETVLGFQHGIALITSVSESR